MPRHLAHFLRFTPTRNRRPVLHQSALFTMRLEHPHTLEPYVLCAIATPTDWKSSVPPPAAISYRTSQPGRCSTSFLPVTVVTILPIPEIVRCSSRNPNRSPSPVFSPNWICPNAGRY